MNINDKIMTPNGAGIIINIEHYSRLGKGYNKRYGVELEINPFDYSPVYYFEKEIYIANTR